MGGGVRELQLTKGFVALLDEADYEWASRYRWYARDDGRGHVYAARSIRRGVTAYLHREVTQAPKGFVSDHIDGDTLRCTRSNLRVCTRSQNARNRRRHVSGAHAYKGIAVVAGRWRAQILVGKKRFYFYGFDTPEDAARAYDRAALEHYGEFARLNFPDRPAQDRGLSTRGFGGGQ